MNGELIGSCHNESKMLLNSIAYVCSCKRRLTRNRHRISLAFLLHFSCISLIHCRTRLHYSLVFSRIESHISLQVRSSISLHVSAAAALLLAASAASGAFRASTCAALRRCLSSALSALLLLCLKFTVFLSHYIIHFNSPRIESVKSVRNTLLLFR